VLLHVAIDCGSNVRDQLLTLHEVQYSNILVRERKTRAKQYPNTTKKVSKRHHLFTTLSVRNCYSRHSKIK
jgi:hypothetical protein